MMPPGTRWRVAKNGAGLFPWTVYDIRTGRRMAEISWSSGRSGRERAEVAQLAAAAPHLAEESTKIARELLLALDRGGARPAHDLAIRHLAERLAELPRDAGL